MINTMGLNSDDDYIIFQDILKKTDFQKMLEYSTLYIASDILPDASDDIYIQRYLQK